MLMEACRPDTRLDYTLYSNHSGQAFSGSWVLPGSTDTGCTFNGKNKCRKTIMQLVECFNGVLTHSTGFTLHKNSSLEVSKMDFGAEVR